MKNPAVGILQRTSRLLRLLKRPNESEEDGEGNAEREEQVEEELDAEAGETEEGSPSTEQSTLPKEETANTVSGAGGESASQFQFNPSILPTAVAPAPSAYTSGYRLFTEVDPDYQDRPPRTMAEASAYYGRLATRNGSRPLFAPPPAQLAAQQKLMQEAAASAALGLEYRPEESAVAQGDNSFHLFSPPIQNISGSKGDLSLFIGNKDGLQDSACSPVHAAQSRVDFLNHLPYEIAVYVLYFSDVRTLGRVARTCRGWNNIARDNELWREMFRRRKDWKIRLPTQDKPLDVVTEPPNRRHKPPPMYTIPKAAARRSSSASLMGADNLRASTASLTQTDSPIMESELRFLSSLDWRELYRQRHTLDRRWKCGYVTTRYLNGHTDSVYCIQFDDRKIVTGSRDRTIKFWDIRTGQCYYTLTGHDASVLCLHYDDELLVTGSSDTTAIVWDMKTGAQRFRLRAHSVGVLDVCADDKRIVTCSKDSTIVVWDRQTGELLRTLIGHRGPVNAVQLVNGLVVSASGDGYVKLWDVETGAHLRDFVGHERGLACVRTDGKLVVSGSNDRTIKVWDIETGSCIRTLEGHTDLVRSLHYKGSKIISGSYDLTVRVWDTQSGRCLLDLRNGHSSWVFDVEFDLTKIVSTSQDQKILVWDFATPDMNVELFAS